MGDVVSFEDRVCRPPTPGFPYTKHRIIAVRTGEAGPEYLTKGDNSLRLDCWIPLEAIRQVVVDVRKNVYPGNKPLFDAVQLILTALNEAGREYLDHTEAICGSRDPAPCAPPQGAARDKGIRLWELTEQLGADYECWASKARRSEYPGHIPDGC